MNLSLQIQRAWLLYTQYQWGLLVQHLFPVTDRFNLQQEKICAAASDWPPPMSFKRNITLWLFLSFETKQCGSISNTNSSASDLFLFTVSQGTENCSPAASWVSPFFSFCLARQCVFSGQQTLTFGPLSKTKDPDKLCYRQRRKENEKKTWRR